MSNYIEWVHENQEKMCFSLKNLSFNSSLFLSAADLLKINLFESFLYYQIVKQFVSRSDLAFYRTDLGPNCLQRLSTDDTTG